MRSVATVIGKGSEDGEEKESLIYWFTSHMAAMTGLGKAAARKPRASSGTPIWIQGPKIWNHSHCFPRRINIKMEQICVIENKKAPVKISVLIFHIKVNFLEWYFVFFHHQANYPPKKFRVMNSIGLECCGIQSIILYVRGRFVLIMLTRCPLLNCTAKMNNVFMFRMKAHNIFIVPVLQNTQFAI